MRILFSYLLITFLVALAGCSNTPVSPGIVKEKHHFIVRQQEMEGKSTIHQLAIHDGFIICLLENKQVMVFDTSLNYMAGFSHRLSKESIWGLLTNGDTVFVYNNRHVWYFGNNHELVTDSGNELNPFFKRHYSDSVYDVYSCCMGEFGGVIYFRQKKSGKVFAYPATCATQVLHHDGHYIVGAELSHLRGYSSIISIKEPTALIPNNDSNRSFCGWRGKLFDSMNDYRYLQHLRLPGVVEYFGQAETCLLATFSFGGELYSVYNKGSAYAPWQYLLLGRHQNYDVIAEDTLRASTEWLVNPSVTSWRDMVAVAYETGKWVGMGDTARRFSYTELMLIKGDSIKILRMNLPVSTYSELMQRG